MAPRFNDTHRLALLTDLYQLTMAYGYWKSGLYDRSAIFHLYYRRPPFAGKFILTAGLESVIGFLENLKFELEDILYLGSLQQHGKPLFDESFLNYLQRWTFQCDVDALPEGSIAFPNQPLIRVTGPLLQAQLLETALLNLINFPSLVATKAARVVAAADGDEILEFGLRRAQGVDGALTASRSAFLAGCSATSNVLAGKYFGIPVKGTHAHSWIMAFEEEIEAFETYAEAMPDNCIFLVDTYDTLKGVRKAIEVGKKLRAQGHQLNGIRLDSGDQVTLSQQARQLLDEAGFQQTKIVGGNDLDEYRLKEMKQAGARIDIWGIGTRLVTAYDQPALGGVYKLAAIKDAEGIWQYRIKQSENPAKSSFPGQLQTIRYFDEKDQPVGDYLYDELGGEQAPKPSGANMARPCLQSLYRQGELVRSNPAFFDEQGRYHDLRTIRQYAQSQWQLFSPKTNYPSEIAPSLIQLRKKLLR